MTGLSQNEKEFVQLVRHARAIRPLECVLLFAVFVVIGMKLPWWFIAVPAIGAGAWASGRKKAPYVIAGIAALSWLVPALIHDMSSGWRISPKVAAVVLLPSPLFLYAVTAVIAGAIALLGAYVGCNLLQVFEGATAQPEPAVAEDKPED